MDILTLFVVVPTLTVIALLLARNYQQVRIFSAVGMGIQLLMAINLIFKYLALREAGIVDEMVFTKTYEWYESLNIRYAIGVDGIAVAMIGLTSVVVFAGVFASWTSVQVLQKEFFISLILLSTGVFGFFISIDLFTMFLFYEIAVIPMYLLIGLWGTGPKEYSAMKLTLMLMGGSAFILLGLLGIYFNSAPEGGELTFMLLDIAKVEIPLNVQRFFFPFLFVGFGVLGALFPFHTWSPDGHASAPTAVSMLHAGVLMKLGGYGVFRVAMYLLPNAAQELGWIFLILTTISVVYGAFGAIWQTDLKYINAYSSVSHCGLVIFGLLMMNKAAMDGAILQMISHGIMTALFFALIGMIYGRTHTRNIKEMGGLMKVMPFLSVAYVIGGMASLGLPGLSGFVAEMSIFVGAFQHPDMFHRVATILATTAIVVTAVYILRVVGTLLLGPLPGQSAEDDHGHGAHSAGHGAAHAVAAHDDHAHELTDAKWYERFSVITLIVAILIIGMAPLWLSDMIGDSLEPIVNSLLSAK